MPSLFRFEDLIPANMAAVQPPRRRQPRWTDDEFKALLQAACVCGANFERVAKMVGDRRAPDACRKQLRVVAERILNATPETSEACVMVVLARFRVEPPPVYQGGFFSSHKETIYVQAIPKSEKDELEVRRRECKPYIQLKTSSYKTIWDVMFHLFSKWGLAVVLCNPDDTSISPDEPIGSVFHRLQTEDDEESYVKVHYRVLRLDIDDELLEKLRSGSSNSTGGFQPMLSVPHPSENPVVQLPPAIEVAYEPESEYAVHQQGMEDTNFLQTPALPPIAPALPGELDPMYELFVKYISGWRLQTDGRLWTCLPPEPRALPPRRIFKSRTYALPPSSNSIDVEEKLVRNEVDVLTRDLDYESAPSSKKPPSGRKNIAVPAKRRGWRANAAQSTPKRQRVSAAEPCSIVGHARSESNEPEWMDKWKGKLESCLTVNEVGFELTNREQREVSSDGRKAIPLPLQELTTDNGKTIVAGRDSSADGIETLVPVTGMISGRGDSSILRVLDEVSIAANSQSYIGASILSTTRNGDDSIALEARKFGQESVADSVVLPGLEISGAGISRGPFSSTGLSVLFRMCGSKENSRLVAPINADNFLRSDASIERDQMLMRNDNALDVMEEVGIGLTESAGQNEVPLNFSSFLNRTLSGIVKTSSSE